MFWKNGNDGTHVVFGSESPVKVLIEEGELLEDIPAHTGYFTEEEESKDASAHTESTGNATIAPFTSVLASCPRPSRDTI